MLLDGGLGLRPKGYGPAVAADRPAPCGALVRWLAALGGVAAAVAVFGPFVAGGGTTFLCGSAVATAGIGGALLVRLARQKLSGMRDVAPSTPTLTSACPTSITWSGGAPQAADSTRRTIAARGVREA